MKRVVCRLLFWEVLLFFVVKRGSCQVNWEIMMNRAFMKPATQSSTSEGHVAAKAVTGWRTACFSLRWVARTKEEDNPVWMVDLKAHFKVRVVKIRHQGTGRFEILVGNSSVSPQEAHQVYHRCASYAVTQPGCGDMEVTCDKDATHVAIRRLDRGYLTLYKVTVLGICSHGYHGRDCRQRCPATCIQNGPICDRHTGACLACHDGFHGKNCTTPCAGNRFGPNCTSPCPKGCNNGSHCDARNKHCFKCIPGFYSAQCDRKCPEHCPDNTCNKENGSCDRCFEGYYGNACDLRCPSTCSGGSRSCDRVTGYCVTCNSGFYGNMCEHRCPLGCKGTCSRDGQCEECIPVMYGRFCNETCSHRCLRGATICKRDTGTCVACPTGFYGPECKFRCPRDCHGASCDLVTGDCMKCWPGYYSTGCVKKCSISCMNFICYKEDGTCHNCIRGYYGRYCLNPCPSACPARCHRLSGICTQHTPQAVAVVSRGNSFPSVHVYISVEVFCGLMYIILSV